MVGYQSVRRRGINGICADINESAPVEARDATVVVGFIALLSGAHPRLIPIGDTWQMDTRPFQVGDQVRLIQPCLGLPAGAAGVITFVYPTVRNLYTVYFAAHGVSFTLYSIILERMVFGEIPPCMP